MTWRDGCQDRCRYSGLIAHLSDEKAIILDITITTATGETATTTVTKKTAIKI